MKHTKRLVALMLCLVTFFTAITLTSCSNNVPDDTTEDTELTVGDVVDDEGNEMVSGKVYAMAKTMSFSAPSMLSNTARAGITLEATVLPLTATNRKVDWSVSWLDSGSGNASDYITVTPQSDGSNIATVTCNKAFSSRIVITVTSRDNPDAKASCTVDYKKRLTSYNLSFFGTSKSVSPLGTASVSLSSSNQSVYGSGVPTATYGTGTVAGDNVSLGSVIAFDPSGMANMLKNYYTSTVRPTLPLAMQTAIDGNIDSYVYACGEMTAKMAINATGTTFKEMVTPLVQLAIFSRTQDYFTSLISSTPIAKIRLGDKNDESSWGEISIYISDGVFSVALNDEALVV